MGYGGGRSISKQMQTSAVVKVMPAALAIEEDVIFRNFAFTGGG